MASIPAPLLRLFAPIEHLLTDPHVSRVLVDGPDQVFVERRGQVEPAGVMYPAMALSESLEGLARRARKPFDDQRPYLEALLKDGTRFLAIRPPAVQGGPMLSITRPAGGGGAPEQAMSLRLPPAARDFIGAALDQRLNFAVIGPSAPARARTQEALTALMPTEARLVIVEEFPELDFGARPVCRLVPRRGEGDAGVSTGELLYCAGRMAADRVFLSEVKRAEAWDVISLLAERMAPMVLSLPGATAADAVARLEALARAAATSPRDRAVPGLLGAGLDVIVALSSDGAEIREVYTVQAVEGAAVLRRALSWRGGELALTAWGVEIEGEWSGRPQEEIVQPRQVPMTQRGLLSGGMTRAAGGPATLNGPPMASVLAEVKDLTSMSDDSEPMTSAPSVFDLPAQPAPQPASRTRPSGEQPTAQVPIPEIPDDLKEDPEDDLPPGPPLPEGASVFGDGSSADHEGSGRWSPATEITPDPEPSADLPSLAEIPAFEAPEDEAALGEGAGREPPLEAPEVEDVVLPEPDELPADSIIVAYPSAGGSNSVHDTEVARDQATSTRPLARPQSAFEVPDESEETAPPSPEDLDEDLLSGEAEPQAHDGPGLPSLSELDDDSLAQIVMTSDRAAKARRLSEEVALPDPDAPIPATDPERLRSTMPRRRPPLGRDSGGRASAERLAEERIADDRASAQDRDGPEEAPSEPVMAGTMQLPKVAGPELAPTTVHDVIDDDALRAALGRLPEDEDEDEDDLTEAAPRVSGGVTREDPDAPAELAKKTFSQVLRDIREEDGSLAGSNWPQVDTETSDMPEALSDPRHHLDEKKDRR